MARETLDLFIKVTDSNGAATFQRLGAAGKKATDEITKGSKTGTTALKDMGREAENAGRSAQKMESAFTAAGAAIGSGVTILSKLGRAATEERRQVDGITRAYGEASAQVLAFADRVQETTVFSNDAAREAALAASSLASNYGLTADQIGDLVARSADLASVFGIDLVDATQRVAGAIRGEGEAAELLALNLSDSAVAAAAAAAGLTGWNTTMTEGEKAAFRYTLLMEQSAYATGAAGDAADTTAGQFKQFRNEVQDTAADLGELAGPAAEAASVLGDIALIAPVAGGVMGKLAAGAATAAGAAGFGGLALSVAAAGAAAAAAIVPLAAVTAIMIKGAEERKDDFIDDFEAQMIRLEELGLEGEESAKRVFDFVRTSNATGAMVNGEVIALVDSWDHLLALGGPYLQTLLFVTEGMELNNTTAADLGNTIEQLYQTQLVGQTTLYGQGLALAYATSEQQAYTQSVEEAAAAEERAAIKRAGRDTSADPRARPQVIGLEDPNADDMGLPDYNAEVARSTLLQEQMAEVQGRIADRFGEIKAATAATAAELAAANQEFIGFVASGENIIDVLIRAGGALTGNQGFLRGVRDLIDAQGALDSTFDTIIGGTERLGQSGQQVADWASDLTGISFDGSTFTYEVGQMQAALDAGKISQDEFTAAVTAGEDILYNNALIQTDIAAIQAAQAPLIADRTNAYQDQIAALEALGAEEQRHALLMMDAGVQTQVAEAYSVAYAASLGEIPKDVATEIILAEAAANPDIDALYRELKLIEEDPITGEIRVNFPDADSMTATLGTLNETLEDLIALIAELNGVDLGVGSEGLDKSADAAGRLADNIQRANDAASGGGLAGFAQGLAGAFVNAGGGNAENVGNDGGNARNAPSIPDFASGLPQGVTIPVLMDYSGVESGAGAVEAILGSLTEGEYTANLYADGKQASATISDTEGQIIAVVEGDWIIPVDADGRQARDEAVQVEGALEDVVGGSYVATINGDGSPAQAEIDAVNSALNYINGTTGVVYVTADTSRARQLINSMTGYQGTAYIDISYIGGGGAGLAPIFATGGTITPGHGPYAPAMPSYANGGTHAMVGEHGPEMVWLPNGSQVTNAVATESRTRGRDRGGTIANYGTIVIQAPNADVYGQLRSAIVGGGGL